MVTWKCKNGHEWAKNENHNIFCPECGLIASETVDVSEMTIDEFKEIYGIKIEAPTF